MSDTEFAQARARLAAGFPFDAFTICRAIVERDPLHAEALHMLGSLCVRADMIPTAGALLQRAIALRPDLLPWRQ
ncbi:hypothetical protein ABTM80_19025, partial [Acinetobacter baumannii]